MVIKSLSDSVCCIVRMHDSSRLLELNRCIFSLVSQEYEEINIIIVTQNFHDDEIIALEANIEPLLRYCGQRQIKIINYKGILNTDHRSKLLNIGIDNCNSKFLGFLDYDDVLYPEAYTILTDSLKSNNAVIAFASVRIIIAEIHDDWIKAKQVKNNYFNGNGLWDLFRGNYCPLHSYLIDFEQICRQGAVPRFDEMLNIEEDYDFILQICAQHASDFSCLEKVIGDYYCKEDGSNTGYSYSLDGKEDSYLRVSSFIEARRQTTPLSKTVMDQLGVKSQNNITIRMALDMHAQDLNAQIPHQ